MQEFRFRCPCGQRNFVIAGQNRELWSFAASQAQDHMTLCARPGLPWHVEVRDVVRRVPAEAVDEVVFRPFDPNVDATPGTSIAPTIIDARRVARPDGVHWSPR